MEVGEGVGEVGEVGVEEGGGGGGGEVVGGVGGGVVGVGEVVGDLESGTVVIGGFFEEGEVIDGAASVKVAESKGYLEEGDGFFVVDFVEKVGCEGGCVCIEVLSAGCSVDAGGFGCNFEGDWGDDRVWNAGDLFKCSGDECVAREEGCRFVKGFMERLVTTTIVVIVHAREVIGDE